MKNRVQRRKEMKIVEKEVVTLAQRVINLDKTISELKNIVDGLEDGDTEMRAMLNGKIARLTLQSQKVGERYDSYMIAYNQLLQEGNSKKEDLITALEKTIQHNADHLRNLTPGSLRAR